jgi:glycolate oxidase iron-sulfur subunit
VAYHDACHLSHGQGVTREPRELLRQIDGVELVELRDPGICCGSAGTYNIEQPATAAELGSRKAAAVLETEADVVVTGNIGCLQQLAAHLPAGQVPVLHTMQLLARSYG